MISENLVNFLRCMAILRIINLNCHYHCLNRLQSVISFSTQASFRLECEIYNCLFIVSYQRHLGFLVIKVGFRRINGNSHITVVERYDMKVVILLNSVGLQTARCVLIPSVSLRIIFLFFSQVISVQKKM